MLGHHRSSSIAFRRRAHVGPMLTVHIHFVGPTSAMHIAPTQLSSWDQRWTNMMALRRANVWPIVGSMLYPRLQNKNFIILFSNSFFFIIIQYHMLYVA